MKNEWDKTPSQGLQNWWLWIVAVVIYYFSLQLGNWLFNHFNTNFNPGANPPWYFIRRDFFQGVGCLAGFITILGFLVFTWRRYRLANVPILAFVCIQLVPGVVNGILIYSRCTNFFDFNRAISYWPTFKAYLPSSVHFNLIGLAVAVALVILIFAINWKQLRAWRKANRELR